MDFSLSEMQVALQNTMSRFVIDRYAGEKRAEYLDHPSGFEPDGWSLLTELGLVVLALDEDNGGLGGSGDDLMVAFNALGPGLLVEPWLPVLISAKLIERLGSAEQKAQWLPALAEGRSLIGFGHVEQAAWDNLHHCATTARVTPTGDYVLDGYKTQVLGPADASLLVTARTSGDEDGSDGISLFLLPADAQGLEIRSYRLADGSHARSVRFDNCVIPGDNLVGSAGAAGAVLVDVMAFAAFLLASEAIGIMDAMVAATIEHLKTRTQFKTPLAGFQVIQHRMADCAADLELARALVMKAAIVHSDPQARREDRLAASFGAKALTANTAFHLAEECVQFHGAMGLTEELWTARAAKRLWLIALLFGDERAQTARYDQFRALGEMA